MNGPALAALALPPGVALFGRPPLPGLAAVHIVEDVTVNEPANEVTVRLADLGLGLAAPACSPNGQQHPQDMEATA